MILKERVKQYCDHAQIRISAFERKAALSNGYFNQVKKDPSPSKLSQIGQAFPDLNIGWLLTGEGEMLKPETVEPNQTTVDDMQVKKWMELIAEALDQNSRLIGQIERMQGMIERMQGIDQSAIGTRKSPPLVFRPETE